jgi:UDPglucose--hexose-1-phosphate uridylyltransferase
MLALERHLLSAEMLDPVSGELVRTPVDVRIDPLTGHSSRILPDRGLMPASEYDLHELARTSATRCPFCGERVHELTPALNPAIHANARIVRGESVLFPNLHAYASHSSVSIYSPQRHYLPVSELSARLVADNLAAQVAYMREVTAADPRAQWASINANHMLPSGSSLFHPHLQGIVDSVPTTLQRMLAAVPAARFSGYLAAERAAGERYLGDTGRVQWLVSFAPIAPGELRAFLADARSPAELSPELIAELAHGLALGLSAYAEMGFESFNLAIYGAPPATAGYPLNLRLACRSNLSALYRSDSTFLERLHWEGAIDLAPERVAELIGDRFRC